MTPVPNNLWVLQGQLFELLEAREEFLASRSAAQRMVAIAEADTEEVRQAAAEELHDAERQLLIVNGAIGDFVNQKVSEVTEIRACYLALIDGAGVAKAEAQRAVNRQMLLENRAARLKELIKLCMETLGAKRFDSAMGQFLIKGNGGKAPVVVTDESLLPAGLTNYTVTLPGDLWNILYGTAPEPLKAIIDARARGKMEPSKSLIAEALAMPCDHCDGRGERAMRVGGDGSHEEAIVICSECGGSGKTSVPGARLEERGDHLEIK